MSQENIEVQTRVTEHINEASKLVSAFKALTGKLPAHYLKSDVSADSLRSLDKSSQQLLDDIVQQRARFYESLNNLLATMASSWIDDLSSRGPGGGANESLIWMAVDKCLADNRIWDNKQTFVKYSVQRIRYDILNEMRKRRRRETLAQKNLQSGWFKFEQGVSQRLGIIDCLQTSMRNALSQRYLLGRTLQAIADQEGMSLTQVDRLIKRALSIAKVLMEVDEYTSEGNWSKAEGLLIKGLDDLAMRGKPLNESGLVPLQVQLGLVRFRLGKLDQAQSALTAAYQALDSDCHSQCGCLLDGLALVGDWPTFEQARQKIMRLHTTAGSLEECVEVLLAIARAPFPDASASSIALEAIGPLIARMNELIAELDTFDTDNSDLQNLRKLLSTMFQCDEVCTGLNVSPKKTLTRQSSREGEDAEDSYANQQQGNNESFDERLPLLAPLTLVRRPFTLHACLRVALSEPAQLSPDWLDKVTQEILYSPSRVTMTWMEQIYWDGQLAVAKYYGIDRKSH